MIIELTAREKAVLAEYARGCTDKQIQFALGLSESALGNYGQKLRCKFAGLFDANGNVRVQLALIGVEIGLAARPARILEIKISE